MFDWEKYASSARLIPVSWGDLVSVMEEVEREICLNDYNANQRIRHDLVSIYKKNKDVYLFSKDSPVIFFMKIDEKSGASTYGFSSLENDSGRRVAMNPFDRERFVWVGNNDYVNKGRDLFVPEAVFLMAQKKLQGPVPDPQEVKFQCMVVNAGRALSWRLAITAPATTLGGKSIPWRLSAANL